MNNIVGLSVAGQQQLSCKFNTWKSQLQKIIVETPSLTLTIVASQSLFPITQKFHDV